MSRYRVMLVAVYADSKEVDVVIDLRCKDCYKGGGPCDEYVIRYVAIPMESLIAACDRHDVQYHLTDS
jgi:hypothetical protein